MSLLAQKVKDAIQDGPYKRFKLWEEICYKDYLPQARGNERADFFLPELSLFIEVDGEQHFHPVAFQGDHNLAKASWEKQKERDKWLNKSIVESKFSLLRISYQEIEREENLSKYLKEKISEALLRQ